MPKIICGKVIALPGEDADSKEFKAAVEYLTAQPIKDWKTKGRKRAAETPEEVKIREELNERANVRYLLVTPEVLAVAAGQKMSLRVRANCAWHIVSLPENASAVASTPQFGDGSIDVLAPSEAGLDGTLVVATDDGSVEAVVTVVPAYPETQQTDVQTQDEESVVEAPEAATNE